MPSAQEPEHRTREVSPKVEADMPHPLGGSPPGSSDGPKPHRPSVLVVEHEDEARSRMESWLVLNGFAALTAASASEAIEYLDDLELAIDVAVVDIGLPDLSGVALCEVLHQFHPFLPVVVFSGQATPEDVGRVTAAGVRHILSKPVDPDQFLSAVKDALP